MCAVTAAPGDPIVEDIAQEVLARVLERLRVGAVRDAAALPAYVQATIVYTTSAKQVVAAMWAVSDAASAIWLPALYASLVADPADGAPAALRAAQLKLRESRMFRHPFYWAGLQAFTRLDVPAQPAPAATLAVAPSATPARIPAAVRR